MVKIRILETNCFLDSKNKSYYQMSKEVLSKLFFPDIICEFVKEDENADICIFSTQLDDKSRLRNNELNILISIENCLKWSHYKHYNKYGDYGNDMVDIFIYNHSDQLLETSRFLSIPTIYFRLNYFNQIKNIVSIKKNFKEKRFCLIINKSGLNEEITDIAKKISKYGQVSHISEFNIKDKSCYNSRDLLEVLSLFKFVICFENSYSKGYITEKIFNCFLANTIPIYKGAPDIENYLNKNAFIHFQNETDLTKISQLKDNENIYEQILNNEKIVDFSYQKGLDSYKIFLKNK